MLKDGRYDHCIGTHITPTTRARIIDAMQRRAGQSEDTPELFWVLCNFRT